MTDAPWELRDFSSWTNYQRELSRTGRLTKVPYVASPNPFHASSTNPDTWRGYGTACRFVGLNHMSGSGFMLSDTDPFVGFDFDDCVDEAGCVHPAALKLVKELDSYTEFSPSGTGLRVFGLAHLNGTGLKLEGQPWGGKLEIYGVKRFMTVTGDRLRGSRHELQPVASLLGAIRAEGRGQAPTAGRRLGTRPLRDGKHGRRRDPRTVGPGERHPELMSLIGGLHALGSTPSEIEQRAADYNNLIPEPLPLDRWKEVGEMIRWLERKSMRSELGFWNATPILQRIRTHSQANRAAPLAVLGAVLARVCAATSPRVVLPGLGHGDVVGSLNSFVALVGEPGSGKDAALGESRQAIELGDDEFIQRAGSGEGFAHVYKRRARKDEEPDSHGEVWLRHAALFQESEVESLVIMSGRKGATLMPELRTIWSGGALGHAFVDEKKRLYITSGSYRTALVVGVQPTMATAILADVDAGTPQRFLWLLCADRLVPDEHGASPGQLFVKTAFIDVGDTGDPIVMDVCAEARRQLDEGVRERLRGRRVGSDLDGHWLLCKLKTAALLAILHGEEAVTERWWRLADWVMQRSNEGRAVCGLASHVARKKLTERRSDDQAHIAVKTEAAVADARKRRCREGVLRKVGIAWVKRGVIRESLATELRGYADDVLAELVNEGVLEERPVGVTKPTREYRRVER